MQYKFSTVLGPGEYETQDLCPEIPIRKHDAADLEEMGTFKAQADWAKLVGPLGEYKGGLGPRHSFMAVSLPECEPDRLEIVSYANEFAFLHDDITDSAGKEISDAMNDEILEAFREGALSGRIKPSKSGKRQMQAKILSEMIAIDRERAMGAMRAWATFVEQGAGRQHHSSFQTLEEYLPYRAMDVGHMFWHALVTFGCALTIPVTEVELCQKLVLPAVVAASLTNDLFSYEKEYETAQKSGLPDVVNALWVLMREHGISLAEAKSRCRARIKEEVVNDNIEVMQYSVSGNVVWSVECPRYHKQAKYNKLQTLRQFHGVEKYPTTYHRRQSKKYLSSNIDIEDLANGNKETKTDETSDTELLGLVLGHSLPKLGDDIILRPYHYLTSLPSKGIREMAIDGINFLLQVPQPSAIGIKNIINMLHSSSLMLDDIEDHSQLRRGRPSTHCVFGEAQTINSATYQYIQAIYALQKMKNPYCLNIFLDEMKQLFIGQSYDLYWVAEMDCPSTTQYLQMIDGKTGGLFRMLTRLMAAKSPMGKKADFTRLCCLFGRYFQIRDDYQNLTSQQYTEQKGICEDLDEGKHSLPLIHALQNTPNSMQLKKILQERRVSGRCTLHQKETILCHMEQTGSLRYTLKVLQVLHAELEEEISILEKIFDRRNHEIRLILGLLKLG